MMQITDFMRLHDRLPRIDLTEVHFSLVCLRQRLEESPFSLTGFDADMPGPAVIDDLQATCAARRLLRFSLAS